MNKMTSQQKYNLVGAVLYFGGLVLAVGPWDALWLIIEVSLVLAWALACLFAATWIGEKLFSDDYTADSKSSGTKDEGPW